MCKVFLNRSYRRLTRPPLNLETDEVLSAVVERLLKALRETRGNRTNAAKILEISHRALLYKIKEFEIDDL